MKNALARVENKGIAAGNKKCVGLMTMLMNTYERQWNYIRQDQQIRRPFMISPNTSDADQECQCDKYDVSIIGTNHWIPGQRAPR